MAENNFDMQIRAASLVHALELAKYRGVSTDAEKLVGDAGEIERYLRGEKYGKI